ncbi:hypothetical protein [Pseudobutyrivibrio sp.]|uniref:hypothetical protein n=1 Tax=Pseudobutyrivibrio sp. TaxID=2014367 RepID=UPI001B554C3F|nr:hypothetical protein [Pseudobutyrivibrio sp.]MBP3263554.1 hypothetical protein [Pseudobutyrivibrio sp.]
MNLKLKRTLEFFAIVLVTVVVALSSPLNPWASNVFTDVQNDILSIAHSVKEGYLAYVELDGHYGPVVYEFYGLGYLLTETHIVQFVMETVLVFFTILYMYKTAKLYTSEIFAFITTALLSVFGWGAFTHAGAEELMFFLLVLAGYHVSSQLKAGFLSHHTYLLAIELGLVFFLQTGYVWIWVGILLFFAVKFKVNDIENKAYRSFFFSILEGLATVAIPMGLYLWYFKNASAFIKQVVVYNMQNLGTLKEGLQIIVGSPWIAIVALFVVVIIVKALSDNTVVDLCCWLGIIVFAIVVIALQGENLPSYLQLSKALYVVPVASAFSFVDKLLGLKVEDSSN